MSDEIESAPATEEVLEDLGESSNPVPLTKIGYTAATVVVPVAAYFVIPFDGELGRVFALMLVIAAALRAHPAVDPPGRAGAAQRLPTVRRRRVALSPASWC